MRIIYANGKSIVIRSLKNPLESDTYIDHQYATTVAKFSPNGSWVASGDVVSPHQVQTNSAGRVPPSAPSGAASPPASPHYFPAASHCFR